MILVIDLGNTNIVFGVFSGKMLVKEWRLSTNNFKIPKIKAKFSAVIVASVVPALDKKLKTFIRNTFKLEPHFVTAGNIVGLKIRLKKKREIGADRVVNALAAYILYGGPAIVVDFGTATTFDVVSAQGEYLGGIITSGIAMARDALYEQTAKLPRIKIKAPKRLIGKDTVSAMRSGLVHGYVAMVEGMIEKLRSEIQNTNSALKVIATGGLARLICKYTKVVDTIDAKLTLKGLRSIGEKLNV
ncbi:hypothetical protein A3J44_06550 [candidate division WOR-1 bacterium RIFCSPHIGHO2_02_FULL_45_12]|uniref:Type III pantothenate kinase n=1 Tax=candidate division WOR-1 bacterium RIFCSPLOWO2_12_FULL_45_9 TaxID=1802568 RepID=A0A1F4RLM5_UNCSA|nr:MAG: hypothetical protein A3J44_06550 [candidate division WOR-1 bacterium RIFCSPHIGHO2_02_FULL_45_12]OGC09058.1 MAG: hypothetical protein A3F86_01220 [candidate division WOR-1 bacterium RIFCSPLOWO2_12_FULL_45_9]